MKTVKIFMVAVLLLVSGQMFANDDFDQYDDIISAFTDGSSGDITGSDNIGPPDGGGTTVPVGNGMYALLALAGVYMLVCKRRKLQNQISEKI